ncbi:GlcG/HbpS family heme-binding protein [Antarcticirhabdus aurantiaca]|uniref:Heme-binding protein n=1 Tax=Antarcticirhabdus aurantiaca TaxID=2606717 RepID=A0ACD4NMZ0_9HYPH|nr:heme-binding protein [Antarcticirhabdus aurantiaca]WAJ28227.1 heme-binding protein [Jeongeuplla avenae]
MTGNQSLLTERSIDAQTATRLIEVAEDGAREIGARVSIAVVDHGGHLVAFRRMDGAYPGSIEASIGKARSCAGFRTPLAQFGKMAEHQSWLGNLPGLIPLGGAVPLWTGEPNESDFVGAVSVSGHTEDTEQQLAERAAQAFRV